MSRGADAATECDRPDLARELLSMAEEEIRLRLALGSGGEDAVAAMNAADARHLTRLRVIVDELGWPGETLVGRDGAEAAWLIAQHADDPDAIPFRRSCLELLARAVEESQADVWHFALLADRVAVAEGLFRRGHPGIQPYGHLQGSVALPGLQPEPIPSSERVEENRAAIGLVPLARHLADSEERAGIFIPYLGARPEGPAYAWRSGVPLPPVATLLPDLGATNATEPGAVDQ